MVAGPAGAVTGGEPDGNRHPNVGALLVGTSGVDMFQLCSGSLIAPGEFLTAGHCTDFLEGNPGFVVSVSFEENLNPDPDTGVLAPATTVATTGSSTMPGFKAGIAKSINDVGVVHLAQPVTGRTPVEPPGRGPARRDRAPGPCLHQRRLRHRRARPQHPQQGRHRGLRRAPDRGDLPLQVAHALLPQAAGRHLLRRLGRPALLVGDGPLRNLTVAVTSATNPTCGTLAENQRLDTPEVVAFLANFLP